MTCIVRRVPFVLSLLVAPLFAGCGIEADIRRDPPRAPYDTPPDEPNPIRVDRFIQVTEPLVDVLFVVDNSSSMYDEQNNLSVNFPEFLDYFLGSGLDYHIGMVATDVDDPAYSGRLRTFQGNKYIDANTANPAAVFEGMKNSLGTINGSQESGRAAAFMALETRRDDPANAGFYRAEAELHIIFVSDADDYSGPNPVNRAEFMNWASNLKESPNLVTMHSIVCQSPDPFCSGGYRPGISYLQYTQATGGVSYSICATDWQPALDALGLQVAGLRTEFFLTRLPVTQPELLLEVTLTDRTPEGVPVTSVFAGDDLCDGNTETEACEVFYSAPRNSISFRHLVPSPLAEVVVTYHIAEDYAAGVVSEAL